MIVSSAIFSVAMLIATLAHNESMLLTYRILAGFGGGFAILCAIKAIAIWLPNRLFPAFTDPNSICTIRWGYAFSRTSSVLG